MCYGSSVDLRSNTFSLCIFFFDLDNLIITLLMYSEVWCYFYLLTFTKETDTSGLNLPKGCILDLTAPTVLHYQA